MSFCFPAHLSSSLHLSGGSGLLGSVATELLLSLGLGGLLGAADGAGAGNGGLPEVGAVTGLSDLAGDVLVGPGPSVSDSPISNSSEHGWCTNLRAALL